MLTCAVDKNEHEKLKLAAIEFLQTSDCNISVKQNKNSQFGILLQEDDGTTEWLMRASFDQPLTWATPEEANKYLREHVFPNLGYKVLRNKVKIFQRLLCLNDDD